MAEETKTLTLDELNKLTFRELKQEHLLQHAKSLGGKKKIEAIKYLIEISQRIPPIQEDLDKKREEMRAKKKKKRENKKDVHGKLIRDENNKPIKTDKIIESESSLYSEAAIEKILSEYKGELENNPFKQKQLYCKKYWQKKLPEKTPEARTFDEKLAAALAEAEEEA